MYLVTGATGSLGKRVVRYLREQQQPVRAFVRLNSRYGDLEQRGAQAFIGDLGHERDIQKACQGVSYVISAHGSNSDGGTAQSIDYRANIDLIDAAKANGIQHFVFISVLGSDRGYDDAPVFKAKRAVEQYLETSGLNYTILRPSGFASSLIPLAERYQQTGLYLLIGDPQTRSSIVSTDDLARIAATAPQIDAAKNIVFAVGGPQALERGEIPKIFQNLFDREPILINPPVLAIDGLRNLLGMFNPELKAALGTLRTLLAHEFYCTSDEVERLQTTFGFQLETLESFLRRYLSV
ncbi:MAG: SDR family oxidoreductase [Kaiparowitsia implicata GSE-PSE-MK54-09C]|jgi:uncharacterized protein YbjT (DUF2867 family)|nr:SDR family oxidoreductase [Kaiparowitsia implicata GSE-PSE-MK54-09C]